MPIDPEQQPLLIINPTRNPPQTPLLPSDREYIANLAQTQDFIGCHIIKIHGEESWVWALRHRLQHWLASKWGHYFVIVLVALDISSIFASFLISLHMCEHGGEPGFDLKGWRMANEVLEVLSFTFSCLFMAELLGSVFAFGFSYFNSPFHIFDAAVIISAFLIDVILHAGTIEEAGSLVIVLRLWRVLKIIEEFSAGADDQISELQDKVHELEREKSDAMKEADMLRHRLRSNGYADDDSMDGHVNGNGNANGRMNGQVDGHAR